MSEHKKKCLIQIAKIEKDTGLLTIIFTILSSIIAGLITGNDSVWRDCRMIVALALLFICDISIALFIAKFNMYSSFYDQDKGCSDSNQREQQALERALKGFKNDNSKVKINFFYYWIYFLILLFFIGMTLVFIHKLSADSKKDVVSNYTTLKVLYDNNKIIIVDSDNFIRIDTIEIVKSKAIIPRRDSSYYIMFSNFENYFMPYYFLRNDNHPPMVFDETRDVISALPKLCDNGSH